MTRKYRTVGTLRGDAGTGSSLSNVLFDLGTNGTHDAEVSGTVAVSGTDGAPDALNISRVPSGKIVMLRVVSGGPFKLFLTSTADGAAQVIPFDDLLFLNLAGSTYVVTALAFSGSGVVEFLVAGSSVAP